MVYRVLFYCLFSNELLKCNTVRRKIRLTPIRLLNIGHVVLLLFNLSYFRHKILIVSVFYDFSALS